MEHFPFAVNEEKQTAGKSKKSSAAQQQVTNYLVDITLSCVWLVENTSVYEYAIHIGCCLFNFS